MTEKEEKQSRISVCLLFFQVAILWTLISLVVWISLKPKSPVYNITTHLAALHKPNSTFHNEELAMRNISIILNLEISNPNERIGICYDDINITLLYNHTLLGTESYPGFYQGYSKTAIRQVRMIVHPQLRRVIWSNSMDVRVCLGTSVRYNYKIFKYKTTHHRMDMEACVGIYRLRWESAEKNIELHQIMLKQIKHGRRFFQKTLDCQY
ncbi:uncharacterized protein LOC116128887 [Pistacia vera]|uniref:uncharacterized protein LOC116128887 n=1 Tax=Pistacia vera TaxID=55513 RepID=UPI00126338E9|nr:uncharacterized protein LOC116128887 [Pistacia vera]